MVRKQFLDAVVMQEEFFSDAALIGIASPAPAYRLCWMLNQYFDTEFARDTEHEICMRDPKRGDHYFAVFQHAAPFNGSKHVLYSLKSDNKVLLPELKSLDYLWMIRGCDSASQAGTLAENLRRVSAVQMAALLERQQLKSIGNLIV